MNKEELKIGAHFEFNAKNKYLIGVIKEMLRVGANSAALFVGPPQSKLVPNLNDEDIKEAKKLAKENNINIENFIVHSRYLINMANPIKEDNRLFSIDLMEKDILTMQKLGIKYINFHPGSSLGKDPLIAIKTLANSLNELIKRTKSTNVVILIETMMSKGNYIGKNFEQIKKIIDLVEDKTRIGVCIDTCHIWDAGYDLKNNYDSVFENFDKIIGFKYLKAFHFNDSKNELGSGKDRHENIGEGYIGEEVFYKIINDKRFFDIPKLLETPWFSKTLPAYESEIKKIKKNFVNFS